MLWLIQLVLQTSTGAPPLGSAVAGKFLGLSGGAALIIGLVLFLLAGAAWGALYGAVAPRISVISGAIFGLLPWLFVMVAIYPIMGKPLFAGGDAMGIAAPLVLNVIWGAIVGALTPKLNGRSRLAV